LLPPYVEEEDIRQALAHAAWRVDEIEVPLPTNIKSVPASVRIAVESLDLMLKSIPKGSESKSN
jgi:hypothetical protein